MIFQIQKTIKSIGFGTYTPEIALLLRNSILVNGMLTNAEVFYNFTLKETEEFEKVDRLFFQKVICTGLNTKDRSLSRIWSYATQSSAASQET